MSGVLGSYKRKANWYDGCQAAWIPKGAESAAASLLDVTGNGNHAVATTYNMAGWAKATGWAGNDSGYISTGIVPNIDTTFYCAFQGVNNSSEFRGCGNAETIDGATRAIYLLYCSSPNSRQQYNFMDRALNLANSFSADTVMAVNRYGAFKDGVRLNTQDATAYTWSLTLLLMARSTTTLMNSGYLIAAAISNKTDPDYVVKARSIGMLQLLRKTIA